MNRQEFLQLFSGAIFVFIYRVIGAGTVFGTQILLARWMGATEVGIYIYAFSLFNLLAIIAGLGLPSSAIRYIGQGLADNTPRPILGLARIGMQITLFSALCLGIAGQIVVYETNGILSPLYIKALAFAMAGIPAMALINWQTTVAQCLGWIQAAYMPTNITRPLLLVATIVAARFLGEKIDAGNVLLWHLLVMLFVWLTSALYLKKKVKNRFADAKPSYQTALWVRTGFPLLFVALFTNFFLDMNIVAVGWYLKPDELAIFSASFRVAVLIAFGIQSVDAVLLPKFSRLYAAKDTVGLQRIITLTTQLKFWSALCGLVIFTLWGKNILAYFGEEFVVGYNALILLSISQLIRASAGPVSQMLSLTGHYPYCLFVSALSTTLMLVLNYFLINRYGLIGAAATVLTVILIESLLLSTASMKKLGINASVFSIFKFDTPLRRVL